MDLDEPLAYFITWTVYGTFLQGDQRGWTRRRLGQQLPAPQLVAWRQERLKHPIRLLDSAQQATVEAELDRLAEVRGWQLWAKNARSNHVHVVVSAAGYAGGKVRDQFKANCTRALREKWPCFVDRPVWTTGGDWRCLNGEDELDQVVLYIDVAQDRKGLD